MLHGENTEWHNARRTICSGINGRETAAGTMRPGLSASFVLADQPSSLLALSVRFLRREISRHAKENPSFALTI